MLGYSTALHSCENKKNVVSQIRQFEMYVNTLDNF